MPKILAGLPFGKMFSTLHFCQFHASNPPARHTEAGTAKEPSG
ncbi:hypothetical protein ACFOHU_11605 [Ottowia pentelensis]